MFEELKNSEPGTRDLRLDDEWETEFHSHKTFKIQKVESYEKVSHQQTFLVKIAAYVELNI